MVSRDRAAREPRRAGRRFSPPRAPLRRRWHRRVVRHALRAVGADLGAPRPPKAQEQGGAPGADRGAHHGFGRAHRVSRRLSIDARRLEVVPLPARRGGRRGQARRRLVPRLRGAKRPQVLLEGAGREGVGPRGAAVQAGGPSRFDRIIRRRGEEECQPDGARRARPRDGGRDGRAPGGYARPTIEWLVQHVDGGADRGGR